MASQGKGAVVALAAAWAAEVGFREVAEAMAMEVKGEAVEEGMWEMETEAAAARDSLASRRVGTTAPEATATAAAAAD